MPGLPAAGRVAGRVRCRETGFLCGATVLGPPRPGLRRSAAGGARRRARARGQALTGLRIVAAVRCAPPGNQPTGQEKATCAPWLDRDLTLAAPSLRSILALGGIGWDATLAAARRLGWQVPAPKPRFGHGAVCRVVTPAGRQIRLVGSYHVSQQNTFTGRLTEPMLDAVIGSL